MASFKDATLHDKNNEECLICLKELKNFDIIDRLMFVIN